MEYLSIQVPFEKVPKINQKIPKGTFKTHYTDGYFFSTHGLDLGTFVFELLKGVGTEKKFRAHL